MAYNPNKELKLYYSIGEVAKMFDVNESLLRYWEKEFPIISPKKAGGNVRQYRKEDIENIRLVYHLVKEKGMTLQGAKQKLKMNRETTIRTTEILDRLKLIREELVSILGAKRSIFMRFTPYHLHLYSSSVRNIPKDASPIACAR